MSNIKKYEKKEKIFLVLLFIIAIVGVGGCVFLGIWSLIILLIFYGLLLTFLPYSTPQFVQLVGYEKSRKIVRSIGIILIIIGCIFAFINIYP